MYVRWARPLTVATSTVSRRQVHLRDLVSRAALKGGGQMGSPKLCSERGCRITLLSSIHCRKKCHQPFLRWHVLTARNTSRRCASLPLQSRLQTNTTSICLKLLDPSVIHGLQSLHTHSTVYKYLPSCCTFRRVINESCVQSKRINSIFWGANYPVLPAGEFIICPRSRTFWPRGTEPLARESTSHTCTSKPCGQTGVDKKTHHHLAENQMRNSSAASLKTAMLFRLRVWVP